MELFTKVMTYFEILNVETDCVSAHERIYDSQEQESMIKETSLYLMTLGTE